MCYRDRRWWSANPIGRASLDRLFFPKPTVALHGLDRWCIRENVDFWTVGWNLGRCITTERPSVCLRPLATDAIFYWVDERVYLLERLFKTLTLFLQLFLDGVRYRFNNHCVSCFEFLFRLLFSFYFNIFLFLFVFFLTYLLLWKIVNFSFSLWYIYICIYFFILT